MCLSPFISTGRWVLFWLGVVVALGAGCHPDQPHSGTKPASEVSSAALGTTVAQVGTNLISSDRLREVLRSRVSGSANSSTNLGDQVLQDLIRFESIYSQAMSRGYDRDPKLQERIRRLVVAQYEEDNAPKESASRMPDDAEVRAYYESNFARFQEPAGVRPAILLMRISSKATGPKREELRRRLEEIRQSALQLADPTKGFDHLARLHSEDPSTRYSGGDCGWLTDLRVGGQWSEEMVQALAQLRSPGEVSGILNHPAGLCLIRLVDRRPASPLPLAKVRDKIAWDMRQERRAIAQAEFYHQQTNGLMIVIHPNVLHSVVESEMLIKAKTNSVPAFP